MIKENQRSVVTALSLAFMIFVLAGWMAAPGFAQTSSAGVSRYPISKNELQGALKEIKGLVRSGEWIEAQDRYKTLLRYDLEKSDARAVEKELYALNLRILFSPVVTPGSTLYTVQSGDSLYKIAKKFGTTIELIKRSNHLKKDLIQVGDELKVVTSKFHIEVDKSDNVLTLFRDGELFMMYPVATGTDNSTPTGTFTIEDKLVNPTWYKAGAVVPPDSPKNILGTRWMGFSLKSYGIHGTTLPETIGKQMSEGCVRMFNQDVEELYDIVPTKTEVTIRD